jgi:hypothetical protein
MMTSSFLRSWPHRRREDVGGISFTDVARDLPMHSRDTSCIPIPAPGGSTCGTCDVPLDIHQPDPDLPDRLLGTCRVCKAWWLLDGEAELMARLPDSLRVALTSLSS